MTKHIVGLQSARNVIEESSCVERISAMYELDQVELIRGEKKPVVGLSSRPGS